MADDVIQTSISRPAPYLEAAGETLLETVLGKKQADGTITPGLISKPIDTGAFAPSVAEQNVLTQRAQQLAADQAGLGQLQFDPETGAVTGMGAGTANLGYQQAVLDAQAQANQMAAYEPYNRVQFGQSVVGGLLSGQPQAYSTQTSAPSAGTAGPLSQALSSAAGIYGLGSLFGR